MQKSGIFVISLDFELYWGVRDSISLEAYRDNLLGVHTAVPALLALFTHYEIHVTWATVGFLFFENRMQLEAGVPDLRPNYQRAELCPYSSLHEIGANASDRFHYAPNLIEQIAHTPYQEIGTHTFSHYYCLEKGQNTATFRADLEAAVRVAAQFGLALESLVFPRNQFNEDYVAICRDLGIKAYRGNENSWFYQAMNKDEELTLRGKGRRIGRLLDAYVNLSGHNGYDLAHIARQFPYNIPSSRFLRPYSRLLQPFVPLHLRRIKADLNHAAKHGLLYHLWWHPHNFGVQLEWHLALLKEILEHYQNLQRCYGMKSLNMKEVADLLLGNSAVSTAKSSIGTAGSKN